MLHYTASAELRHLQLVLAPRSPPGRSIVRLVEEGTPNPQGEALVEELRWINTIVRQNLATILELSTAILGGSPPERQTPQASAICPHSSTAPPPIAVDGMVDVGR